MSKFTNKQRLFCHEYLVDLNATQAAIRSGYSAKTAKQIGFENLTKPDLRKEIDRLMQQRIMSADEVLLRLTQIASGDIGQFVSQEGENIHIDFEKARELGLTKLVKKVKEHKSVVTTISARGNETTREDYLNEVELYSAADALELMGKYHKLFVERRELTGADGKELISEELIVKALEKIYGNQPG